ncbi:glycoside-pentoside-hexuronide (GPH):cation symporter [Cryptosporangium japonicum]|uniref:MFS transporter n=1 Tax=Cryptosporangium japonicum TaxID=80872 RepID=A0ABN0UF62_9ACTN
MTIKTAAGDTDRLVRREHIRWAERIGFGAGDFATSLPWNLAGSFLLYYYTDVVKAPVAALGTLFLVARLLDAVFDPFVGLLVDRTRSRWGKARPYLLFGAIPLAVTGVLMFSAPPGLGDTGKLAFAFATYLLAGLVFSMVSVPYSAMLPMITRDPAERLRLGGIRAVGSALGIIVATGTATGLVAALGGDDERRGWTLAGIVYGVLSVALLALTYRYCRERYTVPTLGGRAEVRRAVRNMLRNRHWVVMFTYLVLNFTRLGLTLTVTVFFALHVLHAPWAIAVLLPLVSGALLVGGIASPAYYRRFGKRRGNLLALGVGGALWLVLPLLTGVIPAFIVVYLLASVAIALSMASSFTLVADTVDYQEWRFGQRDEGLLSAGISLATKVGSAVGAALVAYGLYLAGYDADDVSGSAVTAIEILYFAVPVVLIALQALTIAFYRLEDQHAAILTDLAARES